MGEDGSKKNGANDGGKCKYCGSRNLVHDTDRGEVLCDSCGLIDHMDNLDSEGHVRFGDGSQNSLAKGLGSTFNGKKASIGVRRANKQSQKSTRYMQELFATVDDVVPEGRTRQAVKDLLKRYNEEDSLLWRKRKKLHGGKDRIYRMRVIVSGALAALHKRMQQNQGNEISQRWGVDRRDIIYSTTMFRRFLLKDCTTPNKEEMVMERKQQLRFHLDRFRELLTERVGWEIATQVYEDALDELAENFEPVYDGEESPEPIQSTKYGTKGSESAAWEAFLVSMLGFGMGRDAIIWLQRRAAPSSVGNVTKAYTKEATRRAALSDGGEEE